MNQFSCSTWVHMCMFMVSGNLNYVFHKVSYCLIGRVLKISACHLAVATRRDLQSLQNLMKEMFYSFSLPSHSTVWVQPLKRPKIEWRSDKHPRRECSQCCWASLSWRRASSSNVWAPHQQNLQWNLETKWQAE